MISITLPSIHPEALDRTLDNIDKTTRGPYEVIVVAPFPVQRKMDNGLLLWVNDKRPRGANAAHALAFRFSTGKYVVAWVDDHLFVDGWDILVKREFVAREMSRLGHRPIVMGLRHVEEHYVGTVFGKYYPYFPMMKRFDIEEYGWLSPEFRTGFADADLGLRVWFSGGRCEWTDQRIVLKHDDDGRKQEDLLQGQAHCEQQDLDIFLDRWKPQFGKGWYVNQIRGFNLDIVPELYPCLVDYSGSSINCNDPDQFRERLGWAA